MRVLIVGCGYVGLALGAELAREGHEVFGLRRNSDASVELTSAGITPLVGDITLPEALSALPANYDWVVQCASSSGGGAEEYRAVYLQGARNLVNWLRASPPRKFVCTSSTSVYGQSDGSMVTESSPTEPGAQTAKILVATEKVLLDASRDQDFPAVILRVAGIYGPGRGYWLQQFLNGQAQIEGTGDRILNMIHRKDVVGAIIAALESGRPGAVYNVVDNEPVRQLELFRWLSARLNQPLPPSGPEEAARRRGLTNKKVSNQKLREQLGYHLKYSTFREGFSAELARLGK
jgi:nucleoside-diphosphate-sugar epimerase